MTFPQNFPLLPRLFHSLSSKSLFFSTILTFPSFILQKNLSILWTECIIFFVLALIHKEKIKILPAIILTLFICLFELTLKQGKIIFHFGPFIVTQDPLIRGLKKSAILCGMIFLSQRATPKNLFLPGKIGLFLSDSLAAFNILNQENLPLKKNNLFYSLDTILYSAWNTFLNHTTTNNVIQNKINYSFPQILLPYWLPVLTLLFWAHSGCSAVH